VESVFATSASKENFVKINIATTIALEMAIVIIIIVIAIRTGSEWLVRKLHVPMIALETVYA